MACKARSEYKNVASLSSRYTTKVSILLIMHVTNIFCQVFSGWDKVFFIILGLNNVVCCLTRDLEFWHTLNLIMSRVILTTRNR
jgi:hypothetical protein